MSRDEPDDARGAALGRRERGTPGGVVEVSGEGTLATSEPLTDARRESLEERPRDAMPESGPAGLRAVVEQAGKNELLVGTGRAEERRRALGVPRVGVAAGQEVPPELRDPVAGHRHP